MSVRVSNRNAMNARPRRVCVQGEWTSRDVIDVQATTHGRGLPGVGLRGAGWGQNNIGNRRVFVVFMCESYLFYATVGVNRRRVHNVRISFRDEVLTFYALAFFISHAGDVCMYALHAKT